MNKRQKKKVKAWNYITAKKRRKNKALCKRYPFLIPRNVWSDKIIWEQRDDYNKWSYTLAEEFPGGWWKAFGIMLCEELREQLIKENYLYKFRFEQIKEKFGQLRAYNNGSHAVGEIIDKYSHLSENICISCGHPDTYMTGGGWYSPICYDCFKRNEHHRDEWRIKNIENYTPPTDNEIKELYQDVICDDNDTGGKMSDSYSVIWFESGNDKKIVYDISDTAQKIRDGYNGWLYRQLF